MTVTRPPCRCMADLVQVNGIELAYKAWGDPEDRPVLVIQGVGGQLADQISPLIEALVKRRCWVVTYDNRDIGGSTRFDASGLPDYGAIAQALGKGEPPPVAYTLEDMTRDAVELLKVIGIERAHIVGGSLGGFIAQIMAADFPSAVRTLTLVSTSNGNPELPRSELYSGMEAPPGDVDGMVEYKLGLARKLGSPAYPVDEAELRRRIRAELDRCNYPAGIARQGIAVAATGSLVERDHRITVPTLVLHGEDDPIFPLVHALDLAKHIGGAQVSVMPGMGHDLPDQLAEAIAHQLVVHFARGE